MPTWLLVDPCLATYENHIFSESVFTSSRIVEKILACPRYRILKDIHQESTIKHLPSKILTVGCLHWKTIIPTSTTIVSLNITVILNSGRGGDVASQVSAPRYILPK